MGRGGKARRAAVLSNVDVVVDGDGDGDEITGTAQSASPRPDARGSRRPLT
jgi:hypothetical protein